jgi:Mature-T-Cell Proliferation I type
MFLPVPSVLEASFLGCWQAASVPSRVKSIIVPIVMCRHWQLQGCLARNSYKEEKCRAQVDALYECCNAFYKAQGENAKSISCPKASLLRLKMNQQMLNHIGRWGRYENSAYQIDIITDTMFLYLDVFLLARYKMAENVTNLDRKQPQGFVTIPLQSSTHEKARLDLLEELTSHSKTIVSAQEAVKSLDEYWEIYSPRDSNDCLLKTFDEGKKRIKLLTGRAFKAPVFCRS